MKYLDKLQNSSLGVRIFLSGVAVSFGGMLLLGITNYLIRRTLSLELPNDQFGFFYGMFALAALLTMLFQFGIKQATTILIANFMAKGQRSRLNSLISGILFFTLAGSIVLCLALLGMRGWLLEHFFKYPAGDTAFLIFLCYIFALPLWGVTLSISHGMKEFLLYYGLMVMQMGFILCGCLMTAKRWGVEGVSAAWSVSMVVTLAIAIVLTCFRYRLKITPRHAANRRTFLKIWELCSWMSLSLAGIMLIGNLDTICLTYFSSLKDVANYNIALPIVQIIQSLLVLPFVFMPVASELWHQKRHREIRKIFLAGNLFMLAGVLPAFLLSRWLGDWLISFLFAPSFLAAKPALVILATGSLFLGIGQFNLNLLNSSGAQKYGAVTIIAAICLDLICNLLLIPGFGIEGAAYATALTYLFIAITTFLICDRQLRRAAGQSR